MGLDGFEESIGGKWKLLRNEAFDDYLGRMGIGYIKRKVAGAFTTVMQLKKLNDNEIQIVTDGPKHSDQKVIINDVVEELDPFDNKIKVFVKWDPSAKVLRTEATPIDPSKGKMTIVERKLCDNGELLMQISLPDENFVCKRFFMKQES
ncbi:regulation of retrograde trans-synaptic signaling by endocanabinoid [Mactra antiquata]